MNESNTIDGLGKSTTNSFELTVGNLIVEEDTLMKGDLTVLGSTTFADIIIDNETLNTLTVNVSSTLNGDTSINSLSAGSATTNSLIVTTTSDLKGVVTAENNLNVYGDITGLGSLSLSTPLATTSGGTGLSTIGSANQYLVVNNTATGLTYTDGSGVTTVTASSPLSSSGGANPNISIPSLTGTGSTVVLAGAPTINSPLTIQSLIGQTILDESSSRSRIRSNADAFGIDIQTDGYGSTNNKKIRLLADTFTVTNSASTAETANLFNVAIPASLTTSYCSDFLRFTSGDNTVPGSSEGIEMYTTGDQANPRIAIGIEAGNNYPISSSSYFRMNDEIGEFSMTTAAGSATFSLGTGSFTTTTLGLGSINFSCTGAGEIGLETVGIGAIDLRCLGTGTLNITTTTGELSLSAGGVMFIAAVVSLTITAPITLVVGGFDISGGLAVQGVSDFTGTVSALGALNVIGLLTAEGDLSVLGNSTFDNGSFTTLSATTSTNTAFSIITSSTTGSVSSGMIAISNSAITIPLAFQTAYFPGTVAGGTVSSFFGATASSGNSAFLTYTHQGVANNGNGLGFGFYNQTPFLSATYGGAITMTGSLSVIGSITTTGTLSSTANTSGYTVPAFTFTNTSTATGTNTAFLNPNLGVDNQSAIMFGKSITIGNCGQLGFYTTATNDYINLQFFGLPDPAIQLSDAGIITLNGTVNVTSSYIFAGGLIPTAPAERGVYLGKDAGTYAGIQITGASSGGSYIDFSQPNQDNNARIIYDNPSKIFTIESSLFKFFSKDNSGSLTTGLISISNTTITNPKAFMTSFFPAMTAGNSASNFFGFAASSGNSAFLTYTHQGGANSANSLGFGFYNQTPFLSATYGGAITMTGSLSVTGAITMTGSLSVSGSTSGYTSPTVSHINTSTATGTNTAFLNPNLGVDNQSAIMFGKSITIGNCGQLGFYTTATNDYINLQFFGLPDPLIQLSDTGFISITGTVVMPSSYLFAAGLIPTDVPNRGVYIGTDIGGDGGIRIAGSSTGTAFIAFTEVDTFAIPARLIYDNPSQIFTVESSFLKLLSSATIGSFTTGLISITNTTITDPKAFMTSFFPAMTVGNTVSNFFGTAASSGNSSYLTYTYQGSANSANRLGFGFYNQAPFLYATYGGAITMTGTVNVANSYIFAGGLIPTAPAARGVYLGADAGTYAGIQITGESTGGAYIDFSQSGVDYNGRILFSNANNIMEIYADNLYFRQKSGSIGAVLTLGGYGTITGTGFSGTAGLQVFNIATYGTNSCFIATGGSYFAFYNKTFPATQFGSIVFNGANTVYNTSSDYRIKKNVTTLLGLDKICQLNPVQYDMISNDQHSYGFIAHEVAAIIPEIVTGEKDAVDENNTPVLQQLDYSRFTPYTVAAIKELCEIISTLSARVTALETPPP
jgi:hypothetical protein